MATTHVKQLTAAGYRKVKVAELVAGDVVFGHAFGDGQMRERIVAFVRQERKSTKTIHYSCGANYGYGNAAKVWVKR